MCTLITVNVEDEEAQALTEKALEASLRWELVTKSWQMIVTNVSVLNSSDSDLIGLPIRITVGCWADGIVEVKIKGLVTPSKFM